MDILELRNKYTTKYGQEKGYGSPEFNKIDFDALVQSELILALLDEVKALREDIKNIKTESTATKTTTAKTTK